MPKARAVPAYDAAVMMPTAVERFETGTLRAAAVESRGQTQVAAAAAVAHGVPSSCSGCQVAKLRLVQLLLLDNCHQDISQ